MDSIKTTAAGAAQELNNVRTDDPYEKAAVQGAIAILHGAPFEPSEDVEITFAADKSGVEVAVTPKP